MLVEDILRWFYEYRNNFRVRKGNKKLEELYGDFTHTFTSQITEQQFRKLLLRISLAESDVDLHHPVKYRLFGKKVRKILFLPCLECKGCHPTDFEAYARKIMSDQQMKGRTKTRKPLAAPQLSSPVPTPSSPSTREATKSRSSVRPSTVSSLRSVFLWYCSVICCSLML